MGLIWKPKNECYGFPECYRMFDLTTEQDYERFMLHAEIVLFIKTFGPRYNCYFTPVIVRLHGLFHPGPPCYSLFSDFGFNYRVVYWDAQCRDHVCRPLSTYLNGRDRIWRDHSERPFIDLTPIGSPEMSLDGSDENDENVEPSTSDFGTEQTHYYDSDDF